METRITSQKLPQPKEKMRHGKEYPMQHKWKTISGAFTLVSGIAGMLLMTAPAAAEEDLTSMAAETPIATSTPTATGTTQPEQSKTGWQYTSDGTIFYFDTSGNPFVGIQEIDGLPYSFAKDGALQTGWQTVNQMRYYYDPETGTPRFGWLDWNGSRYYISKENGKQIGWYTLEQNDSAVRYYFDENGVLQTGFFRTEENNGLYYAASDGAVVKGGIHGIDDMPYWFYEDGTLHTGWQTVNGHRYYYHPITGQAECGWVLWQNRYYYVAEEDGKRTGLQQIDGEYYPFSESSGAVTEGFVTLPDNTIRYYFEDRSYQTGWLSLDGQRYYFDENGAMEIGWQSIGSEVYYFDENGRMAVGFTKIGEEMFYFNASGAQQFGLQKEDGKWYYFDSDTGAMHSGWITLDGYKYYFQEDGAAKIGWMDADGKRYYFNDNGQICTGWQTIDGKRYCFQSDGSMVTGWQAAANGKYYYFDENGVMSVGWLSIQGNTYYFHDDGSNARGVVPIRQYKYYFHPQNGILIRNQTVNGVTTNADGIVTKLILSTPYLSQSGFPTGCESASAVMLLRDAGYQTDIGTFVDTALDKGSLYYDGNVLYGPDPNKAFVGDPRSSHGYGCYAPVITNALNRVLTDGDVAKNVTGTAISNLLTNYIDQGTPVAVWATINMMVPDNGTQWIVPETGGLFTWKRHEHCLVLVGYDSTYYYMNDPYNSNGLKAYSREIVEARYAAMGFQAVVIEKH